MNANGGYIFYSVPHNGNGKSIRKSVGTGFDRIALQLAIGSINNQNYAKRIIVTNNENVWKLNKFVYLLAVFYWKSGELSYLEKSGNLIYSELEISDCLQTNRM